MFISRLDYNMQNIQDLSIEELQLQYVELSKNVTKMLQTSCPIVYLKELCDAINCDVSYRMTKDHLWIFFRISLESPIIYINRIILSGDLSGDKRKITHLTSRFTLFEM